MPLADATLLSAWVNGKRQDQLPVHDRGLAYGHGVFETMRLAKGNLRHLELHLDRFDQGLVRLGLPKTPRNRLNRELVAASSGLRDAVLKVLVTGGTGGRGYASPVSPEPKRVILVYPFVPRPRSHYDQGLRLTVCETRLASQPRLAGLKHLNRLEQVLARDEWTDEFHEGLMLDQHGYVIEGTMSNVFAVQQNLLMTAPLDQCGVEGIQRQVILSLTHDLDIPVALKGLSLPEMLRCQEVFVCNSIIGLCPVAQIGEQHFNIGPITKELSRHVNADLM